MSVSQSPSPSNPAVYNIEPSARSRSYGGLHREHAYISIARLWVMGPVGHADSTMTMDVYAQLRQRVKHGRAFDRLVDQAREHLYGPDSERARVVR